MNRSKLLLFLFVVAIVSNDPFTEESLLLAWEGKTIHECKEKDVSSKSRSMSGFVEEVTELPAKIYVSEPIRISFVSPRSFEYLQTIEGKWVDFYYGKTESICFHLDSDKTEKMKEKSDRFQQQLREKMTDKRH